MAGEADDDLPVYDGGWSRLGVHRYQFLDGGGVLLYVLLGELYVVLGQKLCLLVTGVSTGLGVDDYFVLRHVFSFRSLRVLVPQSPVGQSEERSAGQIGCQGTQLSANADGTGG